MSAPKIQVRDIQRNDPLPSCWIMRCLTGILALLRILPQSAIYRADIVTNLIAYHLRMAPKRT